MVASYDQCLNIWKSALELLEAEIVDKYIFDTFFSSNTNLYSLNGNEAIICVKSRMSKVILEKQFLDKIEEALHTVTETNFRCLIKEQSEINANSEARTEIKSVADIDNIFTTNLRPSFTFDNFIIGNCNREAHGAALAVASEPGKFFNPLFIYGKSGIGKTHLLNAIGNYIRLHSPHNTRVLYVETMSFIDDFTKAAKNQDFDSLTKRYENIDVLLIDDIQFLVSAKGTSEFFFNIFNKLTNARKQIVLTSDRQPLNLRGLEERLVSRFSQGLSVNIESPQFDTALSILKKKIEIRKLQDENIPQDVLEYIASKFSNDVRQLEGALNRLIFFSSDNPNHKKISLDTALTALNTIGSSNVGKEVTVEKIIDHVADYYSLTRDQLISSVRTNKLTTARHIAMYLCREIIKDISLARIGKEFGGKDHTTVMNGYEKIERMVKSDPDYRQLVTNLKMAITR